MMPEPFPDRARVDARDKVRGATKYGADVAVGKLLHAMTVPATIVKGQVTAIPTGAAMAVPGVVRVLTHADFAGVKNPGFLLTGGYGFQSVQPMLDDRIVHRGQIVALVVAETLESAVEAASLIVPSYAAEAFTATMDEPGATRELLPARAVTAGAGAATLARAAVTMQGEYRHPVQHHNPMEMISTTAVWADGRLTIHEGTQNSAAVKFGVAAALGLDPAAVHAVSPYTGGGFGQKNSLQSQTVLVARAAMLLGRPIKLVVPRTQIFQTANFRQASRHRITLGADAAGRMIAARYDAEQQCSRADTYCGGNHEAPSRLYGVDYSGTETALRVDAQCPGAMRAPAEHPSCYAWEVAVDEMAYLLNRDPLAFRLAHDIDHDPVSGKPFSSRHLAECLRVGAERFGWSRRGAVPGSMVAADGTQIGWGVACGAYKAATTPAIARLRIGADGSTRFAVAGHELGQGMRTALAAILVEALGCDPAKLDILIGDTDAAVQHLTAGSWGTASVVPTAQQAAERMRDAVAELMDGRNIPGTPHQKLARVRRPYVEVEVAGSGPGQPAAVFDRLRRGQVAAVGPEYPEFSSVSWIAHFIEVHIEPRTRRIRVPRTVSIADCGRVVSPRTAASQVRGGMVWAIGAALREASEVDPRFGGVLNSDLADYVVPVNADIGDIDVGFVDRPDPLLNVTGVKGLGEVAMVGAAAAVVNAIFHATGSRIRHLPIRIEDIL